MWIGLSGAFFLKYLLLKGPEKPIICWTQHLSTGNCKEALKFKAKTIYFKASQRIFLSLWVASFRFLLTPTLSIGRLVSRIVSHHTVKPSNFFCNTTVGISFSWSVSIFICSAGFKSGPLVNFSVLTGLRTGEKQFWYLMTCFSPV